MRSAVPQARHAVDIVEAAYAIEPSENVWLDRILEAIRRDADFEGGLYLFTGRMHGGKIDIGSFTQRGVNPTYLAALSGLNQDIPEESVSNLERRAVLFAGLVEHWGREHPSTRAFRAANAPSGMIDGLSLFVQDAEGAVFNATGLSPAEIAVPARVRAIWTRVGIHIGSAVRLRQHLRKSARTPDALIVPGGKVRHAERSVADDSAGRARLEAAVRSMDRARTAKVRATPERAFELWQGLVAGRWSLVDHWESDGRRYVAAFENRPDVADPRALTPQERIVVRYVCLGSSNKEIAFSLGLPHDSVETAVSRILRKLRCNRRSDLVALGAVSRWETTTIAVDDEKLDVIAVDGRPNPVALAKLTDAERAVAERVVAGDTNERIARRRRSSEHTVANQLRSIYAKLGVTSRAELVRRLTVHE